jgi:Fur family transcriptional regulator, ferric uptake regulator
MSFLPQHPAMLEDVYTQIEDYLRQHHYKLTGPRKAIIRVLNACHKPLGVQEIFDQIQDTRVDLASVYRTVNLLCELNVLVKLDFHDKLYRYELSDAFAAHHHHLICKKCGNIEDFADQCIPSGLEQTILCRSGFAVESHVLEFYGVCKECTPDSTE